jgi:hypothetical protein
MENATCDREMLDEVANLDERRSFRHVSAPTGAAASGMTLPSTS